MFNVSKRGIAKFATKTAVVAVAAEATDITLTAIIGDADESPNQEIHTGSLVIGAMVMSSISGRIDTTVDRIADWRSNRKIVKQTRLAVVES